MKISRNFLPSRCLHIFSNYVVFWNFQSTQNLISRKILLTEKSWNFHTVRTILSSRVPKLVWSAFTKTLSFILNKKAFTKKVGGPQCGNLRIFQPPKIVKMAVFGGYKSRQNWFHEKFVALKFLYFHTVRPQCQLFRQNLEKYEVDDESTYGF